MRQGVMRQARLSRHRGISRTSAEAIVVMATSAIVAALATTKLRPLTAGGYDAFVPPVSLLPLLLLGAAALFVEHQAGARLGALNRQRLDASTGLPLGMLALPWVLAGVAARQQSPAAQAGSLALLHTCQAASAAAVLALLWRCGLVGRLREAAQEGWPERSVPYGQQFPVQPLHPPAQAVLAVLLAPVLLYIALVEAHRGVGHLAALLATAGLACACLVALLVLLPGSFTLGEAVVAAEAVALLGRVATQELLLLLGLLPGGLGLGRGLAGVPAAPAQGAIAAAAAAAAWGGPCRRFVVLLSAGSVLSGALLLPHLLRCYRWGSPHVQWWPQWPPPQQEQPEQQQGASRQQRLLSSSVLLALVPAGTAGAAMAVAASAAACPAALWALRLALSTPRRRLLCAWWAADLAAALPAMSWLSRSGRLPGILVRKGYHLLAASLFLPGLMVEPQLLGVALAAAFTLLLVVEALRLGRVPAIGPRIHAFMTSFIDSRDAGLLLITHFTLLLGMSAPVWLSNALESSTVGPAEAAAAAAGMGHAGGGQWAGVAAGAGAGLGSEADLSWEQQQQALWLPAYAGIMILGFGDTAASAVGSLLGRHPICLGSKKTIEGTAAGVAVTLGAWWLLAAALPSRGAGDGAAGDGLQIDSWEQLAVATTLSCLLEAVTTQLDNIFMPLHYFALLCLL